VQDMSDEQGVPLSSCYRRASELVDQGFLVVERRVLTRDGERYRVYRSAFKIIEMVLDFGGLSVSAEVNEPASEKFRAKWLHSYQVGDETPTG